MKKLCSSTMVACLGTIFLLKILRQAKEIDGSENERMEMKEEKEMEQMSKRKTTRRPGMAVAAVGLTVLINCY